MKNFIKNINIFTIISTLARVFLEFVVSFVWIRYFVRDWVVALVCSLLCSALVEVGLFFIRKRKQAKNGNKKELEKQIEETTLTFLFSEDKENLNFFHKLASLKHKATKKSRFVVVENPDKKVVLLPFYTYQNFSCDNLLFCLNLAKKENPKKVVITTGSVDPEVHKLAKHFQDFEIVILDKFDTFHKLLKFYDCFPEIKTKIPADTRPSKQEILSVALNRKRSKGYFFASFILLLSSFVVRKNIYYLIIGSLLLVLALVSFFNPRFNKATPNNILD